MSKQYEEPRYSTWDDPNMDYSQPDENDEPQSMEQNQDEWKAISDQLDYWADMDQEYWRRRKEQEYELFITRKLLQSMEQK